MQKWKQRARELHLESYVLYLAYRDPRVPWYARLFAAAVVAYFLSPIDLIPDPIPILGQLDDLILVPLSVAIAIKMIPPAVMADCRQQAQDVMDGERPASRLVVAAIVAVWLLVAALLLGAFMRLI